MIIQISLYLTIGFLSYLYYKKWKLLCQVPKNFRYRSDLLIKEEAHGDGRRTSNPTRDRFKEYKVPDNLDAIVIGSGIGGLSCAGYLARAGWKVIVLEQHYLAGGCTHVFKDKGYEFETGIHYIGNIKKRQELLDLITEKSIKWQQLGYENNDPHQMVYDEIIIGDRRYKLRAGEENWLKDMIEWFPEEEKAIRLYLKIVKKVAKKDSIYLSKVIQSKWLQQFYRWSTSGSSVLLSDNEFQDWAQVIRPLCSCCPKYEWCGKTEVEATVEEVLDYLFEDNLEIMAVLAGQFGDYGEVPEKASFLMHASVVNHYLEGGFYPVGGSGEFAKQIIPVIERTGGRVLVDQRVDKIFLKE